MSIFYDPGRIPGWPTGRPRGAGPVPRPEPVGVPVDTAAEMEVSHSAGETPVMHPSTPVGAEPSGEGRSAAEQRVRALRDTIRAAADRLLGEAEPVSLPELYDTLWTACTAVQAGDLGPDGVIIGQQFEALFERLRGLAATHTAPVPPDSLGLPADARFLRDMARYLTERFALDAEE